MSQPVDRSSSRTAATAPENGNGVGAHSVAADTTDVGWKENILGNAHGDRPQNVSWGSIFAGVVTFLAIVFLFSLLTAAFGLDGSGTGAAVFSIIGVLLGFFAAGGVAGAMAVRGGVIHGFLTWAASVLSTVLLVVILTVTTAGAVGGVLGSVVGGLGAAAGPSISQVDPASVPAPTEQQRTQAEQAGQQAQQAAQQAAEATKTGATYGFFGLLLGALVAAAGGLLGSRSVNSRRPVDTRTTARPV